MAKMNIENVVASTYLGQELDLNKIEDALEGAEYNPHNRLPRISGFEDQKELHMESQRAVGNKLQS